MNKTAITATSAVNETDLATAKLGARFGRLDLQSRLALLAVAELKIDFARLHRERVAICLAAEASSLTTDVHFWQGRNNIGGPSPTLFAYTLPSAAVGELAIHFGLTGPNLCFVGDETILRPEAADLIRRGEADHCVGVYCQTLSSEAAAVIDQQAASRARAFFMTHGN